MDIFQFTINDLFFYSQKYLDFYNFLLPLGMIGIWRWGVWVLKEGVGTHYRPKTQSYKTTVSVVTPVYNEDPVIFKKALVSWQENNPTEIIAVIDYTDTTCIQIFKEFAKQHKNAILIVTKKPGKRPALVDGIKKATGEIVALVDSDTLWTKSTLQNGLPPFHDKKMAGVATYQSVLHPKTFAQKIFDVQLDLRYRHEYPFLAAVGNALVCLSGRTAFYRKEIILPMLPQLLHETFLGKPVISGDDKRLTYLVLAAGWKVAYQSNSHVYTPGMKDLGSYLKQRLRWSRNALRADLRAILQGWPIRYPGLLFFQIDKMLQGIVVILSPIFFFLALYFHVWIAALVIFLWWFFSRTVKMYPHLSQKPKNITIVPGFVIYSFFTGIMKIYAFFTLNTQGWITRWDKSRLVQFRFLAKTPAYLATLAVIFLLTYLAYLYKQQTYLIPYAEKQNLLAQAFQKNAETTQATIIHKSVNPIDKQLFTTLYITKQNDTLKTIAQHFSMDKNQILYANAAKIDSFGVIPAKTRLSIPGKDLLLTPPDILLRKKPSPRYIAYDSPNDTITITGKGQTISLKDIQNAVGNTHIEETQPKEWYVKANIFVYDGATLILDKNEASWIKLQSDSEKAVHVRALNADILINGVKITSWDASKNSYDENQDDGRSFLMVKDNSRMDIYDSELSYLGYPTSPDLAVSPYGVSWKIGKTRLKNTLLTGEVINSKFHHNYFGAYTFGATGMLWSGNEFYENTRYGLDPHDDSNGFLVEKNSTHNNGTHGIIFSKRCMYNIIRDNISYNNKLHGIMLHETSNNNVIENNTVTGNTSGIALWRSSNNVVQNNMIEKNRHGIRANMKSNNNVLKNNTILRSTLYGFYLYDNANSNWIENNLLEYNNVGAYIKSKENVLQNNTLLNNTVGIYFKDSAAENIAAQNTIEQSKLYGLYTKIVKNNFNIVEANELKRNRNDISGQ